MIISDYPITEIPIIFFTLPDGQKIQAKVHHTKIINIIKTHWYHGFSVCKQNKN